MPSSPDATRYIACDLGAESGRVMLGTLTAGRLSLEEIHRFPNGAVRLMGTLRWDMLRLFEEMKTGLRQVARLEVSLAGISVDSWGVDYAFVNAVHALLAPPFQYRDPRTDSPYASVRAALGETLIFEETGIQFMPINTLYHLASDLETSPRLLAAADCFLTVGDYFNYLLSGVPCVEESLASTTQLYNPRTRTWSAELIRRGGFPAHIFPKLVAPGTVIGPVLADIARETGLPTDVRVIATCSHDTGAAVAAVPAGEGADWAYLSSGTWSLLGVELPSPLINADARAAGFTNEAGYGGTTRFLKNIVGLWLLQECRRAWKAEGRELDYAALNVQAQEAQPFRTLIRPDTPAFARHGDMPGMITAHCRANGEPVPETPGQFARCILESLALLYRTTLERVESLTQRRITHLHIVGGGSQSALLNQFAASATGREVQAGPVEATAIGNALIQALALGHLASLAELRSVVRASFPGRAFAPQDPARWQTAYERFNQLEAKLP